VMNTCATVLVASTIAFALRLPLLDAFTFIMTAGAMGTVLYLKFCKVHEKWIHCRIAAEICRTALATWGFPRLVLPEMASQAETFSRLKTSLRTLHLCSRPQAESGLEGLRQQYISDRLDDQLHYHQNRSTRLTRLRRRLIALFWICSAAAVCRAIFAGVVGTVGLGPDLTHTLNHFLPLVLPCIAGCALALISVFDLNRQLARSREMETFLLGAREQAAASQSVPALQRVVERAERFLSREISEWYTLSREPRYS